MSLTQGHILVLCSVHACAFTLQASGCLSILNDLQMLNWVEQWLVV
jgi:hypothetical protein